MGIGHVGSLFHGRLGHVCCPFSTRFSLLLFLINVEEGFTLSTAQSGTGIRVYLESMYVPTPWLTLSLCLPLSAANNSSRATFSLHGNGPPQVSVHQGWLDVLVLAFQLIIQDPAVT